MKVLVCIASYGRKNDRFLAELVREYRSMTFTVDLVVLSNIRKEVAPDTEVVPVDLRGKDPWSLPFVHRHIFADRRKDYDLFIYSEDDTLVTERNICAFLHTCAILQEDEIAGFFRFEEGPGGDRHFPDVQAHFHWDPYSVRTRGNFTFAFFTNEHAACYILTRSQLEKAIASGGFLVPPHDGRYDMLCTAATDPYTQCGFTKLVCISHFDDFLVHHLPNRYIGVLGVSAPLLRNQINALMKIRQDEKAAATLFHTETNLPRSAYAKNYYEPVRTDIISLIPRDTHNVLSIGCGWGAMEAHLASRGLCVTAVPLDPVIASGMPSPEVEYVTGDLNQVRHTLAGRRFDCLLFLGVLHLTKDPVELLSCFRDHLSDSGMLIATVSNVSRLRMIWRTGTLVSHLGHFARAGVHLTSRRIVRGWFRKAGLNVEAITNVMASRWTGPARILRPFVADEFVAISRKA